MWIAVLEERRDGPILVGHHGVRSVAPENTLAGIRRACELGIPAVEVDVRFSADSVPVLLHDRDVRRTSNGRGYVDQMTLAELEKLDFGSWFSPAYAGERIPTLRDFLAVGDACGFDLMQLDVKGLLPLSTDSGWARIGREIGAASLGARVQVASDLGNLQRAAALIPGVRTLVFVGPVTAAFANALMRGRVKAVGVLFDYYNTSSAQLTRLDSAGVMVGVWGPRSVSDLNGLMPSPRFVTTDWDWTFFN